jgi:hypothetical protein
MEDNMVKITVDMIKELKTKADIGTVDCKNILEETEGNIDKALQLLAKRGVTIFQKSRIEKRQKIVRKDFDIETGIVQYVRVPIKTEELFEIPEDILENHQLYFTHETSKMDFLAKDTIVYLDDIVEVDDETDKEIYPAFALKYNLKMGLLGSLVNDVIYNTKYQLQNPTTDDFITNLNYYYNHDCFFDFDMDGKK